MKLSNRLQLILDHIPPRSRLADIGSDHALLPTAAVQSGICVSAVAGEVNAGPYQAAVKQVREAGLTETITVRRGDGLEVLEPGEVDVITIAGMGGGLIASILDRGMDKLSSVSRLVLQPNVGEDTLRKWLLEHGWLLINEYILEEDGKIYEVLIAIPEGQSDLDITNETLYKERSLDGVVLSPKWLLRLGPWLIQRPTSVFHAKWRSEVDKLNSILRSLSKSELASAEEKSEEIKADIKYIQEVLACLPKDKL
ncbi:tRNA (adenine22-N1)-methyltransferase [Paenibacillus uliginis N3/975]|uniref:tRNA (Adenine22-N1)-methyltransferase n=1 Tax=Paenibacillus uliginis N3/975 TaxID=1313296 RepID=A0A1X7HKZ6_9BACL|nr:class I SAM-dependent methyltransferase [Paenibacillus uliginis]SMF88496.1 tRNA (adenine22-N1)-methyltransferase [Paenibacillus uliginis N3/975]